MYKYYVEKVKEDGTVASSRGFDNSNEALDMIEELYRTSHYEIVFRDTEYDFKCSVEDIIDFTELCDRY